MIFNSVFKRRKVKQFSYTPRYYDADKEDLQRRRAEIEAEVNGKSYIRNGASIGFKDKWQSSKSSNSLEKKSSIRLAFIVSIIAAFFYWFLTS